MTKKLSIALFILGIALICSGIALIREVYLQWHAWGSLSVGALLVILAGPSWKINLVTLLVPAVVLAMIFHRHARWEQKILLPPGFSGPFGIIYGQACGAPVRDEFGCYVVRIPPNGVAITQLSERKVNDSYRFFYVRGDGLRTPIPDVEFGVDTGKVVFPRAGYVTTNYPEQKVECKVFFLQRSTSEPVPWHGADLVSYRADSLMFACQYGGVLGRPDVLIGSDTDKLP